MVIVRLTVLVAVAAGLALLEAVVPEEVKSVSDVGETDFRVGVADQMSELILMLLGTKGSNRYLATRRVTESIFSGNHKNRVVRSFPLFVALQVRKSDTGGPWDARLSFSCQ